MFVFVVACINLHVQQEESMQNHWIFNNWNKTRHALVCVRGRHCLTTADLVVHYVNLKMLSFDTKQEVSKVGYKFCHSYVEYILFAIRNFRTALRIFSLQEKSSQWGLKIIN